LIATLGWSNGCKPEELDFHGKGGGPGSAGAAGAEFAGSAGDPGPSAGAPHDGGDTGVGGASDGGGSDPGGAGTGGAGMGGAETGGTIGAGAAGAPPVVPGDCPEVAPEERSECDEASEGQVCTYNGTQLYNECACLAFCSEEGPTAEWSCRVEFPNTPGCPEQKPEHRSACSNLDLECSYPIRWSCQCDEQDDQAIWICSGGTQAAEYPTTVNLETPVRDLDELEREAWCDWYWDQAAFGLPPDPIVQEPDPDGYYPDTGCAGPTLVCPSTLPHSLPSPACADNLALSTCEATVGELSACVLYQTSHDPRARGCARYLDTPGCAGTIVSFGPDDGSISEDCRVRVE
jgi:hypothetical protein